MTNSKIQQVVDSIVDKFKPEKIILFGSYAWGDPQENSDVDLLVIKDDPKKNIREMAIELEKILFDRTIPLDLIVYKPYQVKEMLDHNDQFISKILNQGQVLYGN